jgi:twitching motility protein PilT
VTRVHHLFEKLHQRDGSDLHLSAGRPPMWRLHGEVTPIPTEPVLDDPQLREMLAELIRPDRWDAFLQARDIDFACQFSGIGRFRANYFFQENGVGAVFRMIPETVISFDKLGLPKVAAGLADLEAGLVLVTGPTGSGKSTTLAAIIDLVNDRHPKHIVTIEDPVEFVHRNKRSVISQREVGTDTLTFSAALRSAVRQDADVILVGEMRDLETISLAITAASMGVLVFGTLHTSGAAKTVDRIIDAFPADEQPQARTTLAESLSAVVSQILLPRVGGKGRVAAHEILLRTQALPGVIREGKISMLNSLIASNKALGMQTLDDALLALVEAKTVEGAVAYSKASDKQRFAEWAES